MLDLIPLMPLLPLAGAIVLGLLGRRLRLTEKVIGSIACGTVALAFVIAVGAFYQFATARWAPDAYTAYLSNEGGRDFFPFEFTWIPPSSAVFSEGTRAGTPVPGGLAVKWVYQLDALSALMALVVTGVGLLIHVFATGYMRGDRGYYRFFASMNLFVFSMLVLVLGSNLAMLFVGWEGVGLCSYLLIGYYFDRHEAGNAAKKAFVVNRIGDAGLLLGIFGVFALFGTLDFVELRRLFDAGVAAPYAEAFGQFGLMSLIALGLFVGAIGKSAQIPLFVWLPDAMAGPTPVSALIHAATMVTAGVYLVTRMNFVFQSAPTMMFVVAITGALTALLGAAIALTQNDIKKVLAYSTVSQLGLMFVGCGVGAFAVAVFHLMTHAFFKAQLFLGAGSVIHGLHHEQDMRRMGGLRAFMPTTHLTMLAAWLALAGIFPFAGFFSKDEILWRAWSVSVFPGAWGKVLWAIGFVTAGCTAFYATRLMMMTFYGEPRFLHDAVAGTQRDEAVAQSEANLLTGTPTSDDVVLSGLPGGHGVREDHLHGGHDDHVESHGHVFGAGVPKESSRVMTVPLVALAVLSLIGGWVGIGAAVPVIGSHEPPLARWLAPVVYDSLAASAAAAAASSDEPVPHVPPAGVEHAYSLTESLVAILSLALASAGIVLGIWFYTVRVDLPGRVAGALGGLYALSFNRFWVDELYARFPVGFTLWLTRVVQRADAEGVDGVVNGTGRLARLGSVFSGTVDRNLIDRAVRWTGGGVYYGSLLLRAVQTGVFQNYALVIVLGLLVFFAAFEWNAIKRILDFGF